jgi:hypothetical protein
MVGIEVSYGVVIPVVIWPDRLEGRSGIELDRISSAVASVDIESFQSPALDVCIPEYSDIAILHYHPGIVGEGTY